LRADADAASRGSEGCSGVCGRVAGGVTVGCGEAWLVEGLDVGGATVIGGGTGVGADGEVVAVGVVGDDCAPGAVVTAIAGVATAKAAARAKIGAKRRRCRIRRERPGEDMFSLGGSDVSPLKRSRARRDHSQ
jgi:hypothetical protein